jgi:hypothetical protein
VPATEPVSHVDLLDCAVSTASVPAAAVAGGCSTAAAARHATAAVAAADCGPIAAFVQLASAHPAEVYCHHELGASLAMSHHCSVQGRVPSSCLAMFAVQMAVMCAACLLMIRRVRRQHDVGDGDNDQCCIARITCERTLPQSPADIQADDGHKLSRPQRHTQVSLRLHHRTEATLEASSTAAVRAVRRLAHHDK